MEEFWPKVIWLCILIALAVYFPVTAFCVFIASGLIVWFWVYERPKVKDHKLFKAAYLERKALYDEATSVVYPPTIQFRINPSSPDWLKDELTKIAATIYEQAFLKSLPPPVYPAYGTSIYAHPTPTWSEDIRGRKELNDTNGRARLIKSLEDVSDRIIAILPPVSGSSVFHTKLQVLRPTFSDEMMQLTNTFCQNDFAYGSLVSSLEGPRIRGTIFSDIQTPFDRICARLQEQTYSYVIPDEARFRGQWIIGPPGAGKTTFISVMIAEDLKKVARNEASIFVMDSQNELVPDIARLEMFARGRPLHGKLIYLEPDPDFPLALNIFDTNKKLMGTLSSKDRVMLESGAIWMVEFFLSSLVKSEASPHQDTFLNYVIPALLAIPDATIFTFKELLEPAPKNGTAPGYERYKKHFSGLRQDTQDWLRDRMHSPELAPTRNAIRTRLDGFTARGFFHDMFMHPRNKLDLFEELQSGKVILVNTMKGLLKNGTEPFGRYFIARLLQAAEERMFLQRGTRLPVYAYIDEASDYISEEENIEELVNKARKQNVALIIANQMASQITSPTVRDALGRMAIQCRGVPGDDAPRWEASVGTKAPVEILVPNVNFSKMPKMSERDFEEVMDDMHRRFSGAIQPRPGSPDTPNYDLEWTAEISPKIAETGGTKKVHGVILRIMPGTKNGHRVRLRGKGAIKPDGTMGDAYITFSIRQQSQPTLGYFEDETDAKPW